VVVTRRVLATLIMDLLFILLFLFLTWVSEEPSRGFHL
jgi:hypothetical protein